MSDLTIGERKLLEKLLGMGGGYVLDFSASSFVEFFNQYQIDIDAKIYRSKGVSRANRMRDFCKLEPNPVVGRVIAGMIDYAAQHHCFGDSDPELLDECRKIVLRLLG